MSVLLTGATGFIGRAVMEALLAAGYRVTALVDDQDDADEVRAAGADPFLASEEDTRTVADLALESDGVIHTATSRTEDADFIAAVTPGLLTSDKPFVYTSSLWTYGSGRDLTEKSPAAPPPAVTWMAETVQRLLADDGEGMRVVVVAPGIVYGHGQGIPRRFVDDIDRSGAQPVLPLIGDGSQRWATVHVDDLADLYVRIIGAESHDDDVYIAASGASETVAELAAAAAHSEGATVRAETAEETAARIGSALAGVLLLDQHAAADRARERLGWRTTRPSLVDELRAGYLDAPGDPAWG
ncbi:NAD-dependent epimerase/dehydratase family protein [Microbacterium azadirachtae]|jgi:nucleoside-diphosphate-sugar epimerase|uniref:Nucleoside-diphosphate-sugar epimerase n=1 Tax=Microbacterium azadirachtae TaxID=582680 RepID=A0A1I6HSH1_9MICO|nr:NAD-dependent epimerase/dehydratase family protein [Microbacterium azadirachtae]SFR57200.1 Nucleoside-diphosphate-sugar epimerase [Microbacterium azadirachtae]